MSSDPGQRNGGAVVRLLTIADRPVPLGIWLALLVAASLVWAVPAVAGGFGLVARDWDIYGKGRDLWLSVGSPYAVPPPGWDPMQVFPYLYPPTSWPLLLLTYLPWPVVMLGLVPIALTPPRLGPAIPAILLYAAAVGQAVFFNNVNVLIAGLIVLAFRPGATGGLAFAVASAVKMYPLALLPLLWRDHTRLAWTVGSLAVLTVSGTLLLGIGAWGDFFTTLVREGPYPGDRVFNPLTVLGPFRLIAAAALVVAGLGLGSPTLTLIGATWVSPGTTIHYLLTFVAALCVEPPLRGRSLPVRALLSRVGRIPAGVDRQLR